ncbi:hypothetical protein CALVIDRAFT_146689 [Calocera viscosa TUFC12733]|uniref:Pre-rRNA-processing protein n=1 Tax=Calocera viscosa (strain TUFC12733) TaxID=1330018 RepID=A0A167LU29_CALVF|nr:hypothetical protein CALVIDRAFT_146689 [Calocera viscosa TUFC12733]
MPKSSKKKKERASDFTKAKLKLGKGKKAAINATDTSFKAKSINIPTQNIDVPRDEDEALTRKSQTFSQVLSRLRHYNATVRKDSLYGLKEILRQTGMDNDEMLSRVFEVCGRLVGDEDTAVRKALIEAARWITNAVSISKLEPHVPLLLLHVLSNMAHIFPEVRIDAIRVLRILLDRVPSAVILDCSRTQSTGRILDAFRSILQIKHRGAGEHVVGSTSSVILSPPTKSEILSCLRSFLAALSNSVSDEISMAPLWYLRNSFDSRESFEAFQACLSASMTEVVHWSDSELDLEDWLPHKHLTRTSFPCVADINITSDRDMNLLGMQSADYLRECVEDFTPALADMVLDASSIAISYETTTQEQHYAEIVWLSLSILEIIFASVTHGAGQSDTYSEARYSPQLDNVLNKLAGSFPNIFQRNIEDAQVVSTFGASNRCYCQLVALHQLASRRSSPSASRRLKSTLTYVLEWLDERTLCTVEEYLSMIPVTWCLLNTQGVAEDTWSSPTRLFTALVNHAERLSIVASVKDTAFDYIGRLILLQENRHYLGHFRLRETDSMSAWLLDIPRLLWELGAKQLQLTEKICLFLLRALQQRSQTISSVSMLLAKRLIPFFYIQHPTRGPTRGPCGQLPPALQRLCCDMAASCLESVELQIAVAQFRTASTT